MADHRGTKSAKSFLAHFDRARDVQFDMAHNPEIFSRECREGNAFLG